MSEGHELKAKQFELEAQKKVDSVEKSIIVFGSKSQKYEDAAELYGKAGNMWKLSKKWIPAGNAYMQSASCLLMSSTAKHQAISAYVNAAHCFGKEDVTAAVAAMLKAINMTTEDGRLNQAAKYEKEVAEMFEQISDIDNAMKHFQIAADYYETEGSPSTASGCLLKVAHFAADKGDYHHAIETFEKVAEASMNGLGKYSVKEYYLKAGMLYLCLPDVVAANKAIEKWSARCSEFSGTREHKFLQQLIEAFTNLDVDAFRAVVGEWDTISKLDSWKQGLLVKIMEHLEGEGEEDFT